MQDKKVILICGYPKSGTTWATRLVAELVNCPADGFWGTQSLSLVAEGSDRVSQYVCYKSHHLYGEVGEVDDQPIYKIIHIVRDPRDITVSGAHHFPLLTSTLHKVRVVFGLTPLIGKRLNAMLLKTMSFDKRLSLMIEVLIKGHRKYIGCRSPWHEYVASFVGKDVLTIRYEDLLQDGEQTVEHILEHLGIAITDHRVSTALSNQSFDTRKQEFLEKGAKYKYNHLRIGQSGGWKKVLNPSQIKLINTELNEWIKKFNY